ncbi:MAG TPA: membrane protein insertase YidC [Stellaceae bacterium]|nr:membrane protein insertase YidC [Stellaceae bacterium]
MDQQKNLILAIVLSVAILFGFQYFLAPKLEAPQPPATQTQSQPAPKAGTPAAPGTPTTAQTPTQVSREAALKQNPRVQIKTPRLSGSIDLVGAKIDDLTLTTYREEPDPNSPEIVLLAPEGTEHPYFAEFGWVATDPAVKLPGADTRWTSSGDTLSPGHPVTFTWDNGAGLRFTRRYTVDENYMFTVTQSVTNNSGAKVTLYPYGYVARKGEVPVSSTYLLHEGPIGVFNGTLEDGYKYSSLDPGKPVNFASTGGWLGFTDKYWLTALIPDQKETISANFQHFLQDRTDVYQADYRGAEHGLAPAASVTVTDRFFAGAKELALLQNYEDSLGIPLFDRAIDFGWFWFLTKPIFLTLDFFYGLIGNFGLAIMLLTVIIKLIFFPLANKSYKAMSKMKQLQPEMQKLRERFGDDKAKLNQEMMALYKRVGANPMAGCLPIAIQIPVFFSLYKVLYVTIEMRQAPFFGWIHDLSAPDPTSFANLFGLLHFTPPHILMIGAWPIIMGITMFLQQKLNPQPPDPVQAKMFMALPFVFTYMLAQFASGLVIYWAWNNTLSIAQQWVIMRRAGVTRGGKPVKT